MTLISCLLISFLQLLNANQDIELVFTGDAMQHIAQIENAKQSDGSYNYDKCFTHISQDIETADLAVVNLEVPLGGKPYAGYPCFSAPNEFAMQLKKSGFDIFLTANNHCLDRRDKGLISTIDYLNNIKVKHIGTYRNKAERDTINPLIIDIKGVKIGFLNYTYGTNGITIIKDVVVDYIDRNQIAKDIEKARNVGAEVICVAIHWGNEYQLLPHKSQKDLADFLVEKGVDLIIGGHPHVIQPMEIRRNEALNKDVLVVYSLGNFISNMKTTDTRGGAMVKVTLKKKDNNIAIKNVGYKLFFTVPPISAKSTFTVIPADRPDLIPESQKNNYNLFLRNARNIFNKHNINVPEIK